MRHRLHHRKLNRTSAHRKAMHRNLTQSMIEHGSIRTTLPKAKDLRPVVEKMITLALQARNAEDSAQRLSARRRLHKYLSDRAIIPEEHKDTYEGMSDARRNKTLRFATGRRHRTGQAKGKLTFTAESVLRRLIDTVAPRFEGRPGGYTRVIRLAGRRLGDHTRLAILQFVGDEQGPGSIAKPRKTARRTRTDARYGAAVKALRGPGKSAASAAESKSDAAVEATTEANA